jgi:hypothetical protein
MMRAMLFGIVVAVALAWIALRIFAGYPVKNRRFRVLNRAEAAVLDSVAEAMFPPGGHIESSGRDADLPAYADRWMAVSQPRIRVLMHLLFFLIEHATVIFPAPGRRRRRRYSSLTLEQRIAVLEGWGKSRLHLRRRVFVSLRSIFTKGYFAHPPVLRQLRVAPFAIDSPVCEADLLFPPIGKLPADIRYTREDLSSPSGVPLTDADPLHPDFAEPVR